jgi:HSP20 family protein
MNKTVATKENRQVQPRPSQEPGRAEQSQQAGQQRGYLYPHVNIVETKDSYVLEAEMPGVSKDGLEILLEGNELTILGHRSDEQLEATCVYRESSNTDYRRVFELDPTIDSGKIAARMENGILHLELPKAEKVKPRKITVE